MNAPDPFASAPDWWLQAPWPLPSMQEQADQYQRDAIAEANAARPDEETADDLG